MIADGCLRERACPYREPSKPDATRLVASAALVKKHFSVARIASTMVVRCQSFEVDAQHTAGLEADDPVRQQAE
jgi:hypothetical protein